MAQPTLEGESAVNVCRSFNTQLSTHFYSASSDDCAALKAQSAWIDEGTAFRILRSHAQTFPPGSAPVFRLFSVSLATHRYTARSTTTQFDERTDKPEMA